MWTRRLTVLLAVSGWLALLAAPALAAERVALVIGNASYDARAKARQPAQRRGGRRRRPGSPRLFGHGSSKTPSKPSCARVCWPSRAPPRPQKWRWWFYAGHGIEVDQRNFLVPVDAKLASDQDVEFETVPLALVMRSVARASGLRLVILDACRENPFAVSMQRIGGTRSIGRGLARVEPAGETLVAYAAKGGTVASDGEGRNSPYSAALLAHIETPGLEIMQLFREVRDAVLASTGGRQEPFTYGSLSSRGVYLTARVEPDPASLPAGERLTAEQLAAERLAAERELLFWQSIKDSTNPADFEAYLERYPAGVYAALARNRLKALRDATVPTPAETAASVEAVLSLKRSEFRLIQLGLAAAGYDPGPADGLIGEKTRAALRQWQASRGEAATGYLDVASAKLLLASGEAREAEKQEASRQAAAEAARLKREQEARERAQREAAERERRAAQERARRGRRQKRSDGGSGNRAGGSVTAKGARRWWWCRRGHT